MALSANRRPSSLNRSSSGGTPLPPRQHISVTVDQYQLDDKNGRKSNPEKDKMIGRLNHDVPAWGMKQGTQITVEMPLPSDGRGSRRRDIQGLSRPKGQGLAIDAGGIVVFERAYFDRKSNTVKAPYSHGAASSKHLDPENPLKMIFSNMLVCVRPEDTYKSGTNKGKPVGRVDVMIADPDSAFAISSRKELEEVVDGLVHQNAPGNPGFQLLARGVVPQGQDPAEFASDPNNRFGVFMSVRQKKVEEEGQPVAYVRETTEEVMARFDADCSFVNDVIGSPDFEVSFVPMMVVNQAKSLVPSQAEEGERVRDNSAIYAIYGKVPEGAAGQEALHQIKDASGTTYGQVDCGWKLSHVVVEHQADNDFWYSTYQAPMAADSPLNNIHDLNTKGMSENHVAAVSVEANLNNEARKIHSQLWKDYKDNGPAPDEDAEPDSVSPNPGV